jgi:hypothetical protein
MSSRAFVIGNGPSLAKIDLDRMAGETTYACNRIQTYPGWDDLRWRPTEYFFIDRSRNRTWADDVAYHLRQGYRIWLRQDIAEAAEPTIGPYYLHEQIRTVPCCAHNDEASPPTGWHLPAWCQYGGSVAMALQRALQQGHDPVIVLGCDLGYRPMSTGNHFTPDYQMHASWASPAMTDHHNAMLARLHEIAAAAYADAGQRIYNATPGGTLEAYERISFEEALEC